MTNKIIIDAWNVCWKIPDLATEMPDKLERVRTRFNLMVQNHFQLKNVQYKIFYDGQPDVYTFPDRQSKKVHYSSAPQKADDLIVQYLKKQSRRDQWTVITSDRQLTIRVKNLGAVVMSSENFIQKLTTADQTSGSIENKAAARINKGDIDYWLKKFNSDDK